MDKYKEGLDGFLRLCSMEKDLKILSLLFDLFLTSEERQDIAMRYLIIKALIKQEKTQREIAKDLKVSIAKITRGSNELKRTPKEILDYLNERMLKS